MARITLDSRTFQALASATRLGVLRALDERRKTLTELARDLELNKATVHEHLQLLTAAGLVKKRDDEGRKWIYYELTWTGEKLLHPQETTTFSVLLGLTVAAAGGGFLMLGRALGWWLAAQPLTSAEMGPEERTTLANAPEGGGDGDGAPAASGAGAASGTATGTEASPGDTAMHDSLKVQEPDRGASPDTGEAFWDDGGWLSVALLLASAIFTLLAVLLRRHLRPGRFVPPEGEPEGDSERQSAN